MDMQMRELECGGADRRRAIRLIGEAGLPTEDLADAGIRLFGFFAGNNLVGTAALQPHDDGILLRSVAVCPEQRGRGRGTEMVRRTLAVADAEYGRDVYLLTETAEGFFAHCGFHPVRRDRVPPGVAGAREFSELCPDTAPVMVRRRDVAGGY